jgi:molybdopterin/thiamine biosynthesis adenylyltransferase
MNRMDRELSSKARFEKTRSGADVRVISEANLLNMSSDLQLPPREVFIRSMELGIVPLRYLRNSPSIGLTDQITLARSRVAVAGAGGLGGHVIELLVRLGIGELRIFDPDAFDETNLNRQTFAEQTTLGIPKVYATRDRCRSINPAVEIIPNGIAVTGPEQSALFEGVHIIVDALDTPGDRLILAGIAKTLSVPLIHGAVAGFEGRILTVLPGDPGLAYLYDGEDNGTPAEIQLGTPAPAPALIASIQVMSVVNFLLKRESLKGGEMVHVDLNGPSLNFFSL